MAKACAMRRSSMINGNSRFSAERCADAVQSFLYHGFGRGARLVKEPTPAALVYSKE
jgi:hypothetical protein